MNSSTTATTTNRNEALSTTGRGLKKKQNSLDNIMKSISKFLNNSLSDNRTSTSTDTSSVGLVSASGSTHQNKIQKNKKKTRQNKKKRISRRLVHLAPVNISSTSLDGTRPSFMDSFESKGTNSCSHVMISTTNLENQQQQYVLNTHSSERSSGSSQSDSNSDDDDEVMSFDEDPHEEEETEGGLRDTGEVLGLVSDFFRQKDLEICMDTLGI